MKLQGVLYLIVLNLLLLSSCTRPHDPNLGEEGVDELKSHALDYKVDMLGSEFYDLIYVPIYSDVYVNRANQENLIAATLSIRNTSYADTLYVGKIDYFDSHGDKVRSYIKKPIGLAPMASVNYVIEKEDDAGGSGANFMVSLAGSNPDLRPIVQAVMIGENGKNQGFAFAVDGYSIVEENRAVLRDSVRTGYR